MADRFDKFTEGARRVLTRAQEEAQRFHHNHIGTEHVLLALVRDSDSAAARVLAASGVNRKRVRSAVEQIIGSGDQVIAGQIDLTSRARKAMELAIDEASRLNHRYVGTEHLLIALLREGEGIAAWVLLSFGLTLDRERARTLVALGEQADSGQGAAQRPTGPMQVRRRITRSSSTTTYLGPMPGTGGPPLEPGLEDLLALVSVAQTQRYNDVNVTVLSTELYTDGFLVNMRLLLSEPGEGSTFPPIGRSLPPTFEAEDDRGNRFTGGPYFEWSSDRQRRYVYRFMPQLDSSAHELRLRCTDLRLPDRGQPGEEEIIPGPFNFSIPLGDRLRSGEARPDR